MTDIEKAIVEKAIEKIDMDALTDKIAEIVADRIIKKEFPTVPPLQPGIGMPWTAPKSPFQQPVVVMYGCNPDVQPFYAGDILKVPFDVLALKTDHQNKSDINDYGRSTEENHGTL